MNLYIKNMVCNRCKLVVKEILEKQGLHPIHVDLGEVEIEENQLPDNKSTLVAELEKVGFELLDDQKTKLIEKIKTLIIDLVHNQANQLTVTLSEYLSSKIGQDYSNLSNLFSEVEGQTIEKYYIGQRIEKVKELLVYDDLTLSEIAFQLNYSSAAYLSNQFKKITGLTPRHFKKIKTSKRLSLDEI